MGLLNIWHFIHDKLRDGQKTMMVIKPVHSKYKSSNDEHIIAVSSDGSTFGTIAEGALEYKEIEYCREKLKETKVEPIFKKKLKRSKTLPKKSKSDELLTLIYMIFEPENANIFEHLIRLSATEENCSLFCSSEGNIKLIQHNHPKKEFLFTESEDNSWSYQFPIDLRTNIFLIGADAIGLALCKQLSLLDFKITLIDNRSELDCSYHQDYYHSLKICTYRDIEKVINSSVKDYILILHHSSALDELLLSKLIHKPSKFIGIVATKDYIEKVKQNLFSKKLDPDKINKIQSPSSRLETSLNPAEMAVNIAAGLLAFKYQNVKRPIQ